MNCIKIYDGTGVSLYDLPEVSYLHNSCIEIVAMCDENGNIIKYIAIDDAKTPRIHSIEFIIYADFEPETDAEKAEHAVLKKELEEYTYPAGKGFSIQNFEVFFGNRKEFVLLLNAWLDSFFQQHINDTDYYIVVYFPINGQSEYKKHFFIKCGFVEYAPFMQDNDEYELEHQHEPISVESMYDYVYMRRKIVFPE